MEERSQAVGTVEFARLPESVAVLRLVGRCSFHNSANLKKAAELCESEIEDCRFVLDFERCQSMDSTFLGTLAGIALRQRKRDCGSLIAVNVSKPLRRTMDLMGLSHVLELRDHDPTLKTAEAVEVSESQESRMSKAEQVAHMIEAHQTLIEVDSGNEVRFENVIKYLGDSLERAKAQEKATDKKNES